jgi:hypothetical protein
MPIRFFVSSTKVRAPSNFCHELKTRLSKCPLDRGGIYLRYFLHAEKYLPRFIIYFYSFHS